MHAKSLQSHPTLGNCIDHSPLGSSIPEDSPGKHYCALLQGIFMTQGLNWCLMSLAFAGRFLTTSTTWEAHTYYRRYTYMHTYSIYLYSHWNTHTQRQAYSVEDCTLLKIGYCQKEILGTSLVVQWLRIHLPMQGTRVWSLVPGTKIPHTLEQLSPLGRLLSLYPRVWVLQQEKSLQWEAHKPQLSNPTCHSKRKPAQSNKGWVQPKIN